MIELSLLDLALLTGAGVGAGLINTVVGSGSLVSFPALLALGYPPVLANVTNNIGVLPGSISGAIGYRHELKGQWRPLVPLLLSAGAGGIAGALLLLVLPSAVFDGVVPLLIALALVLVIFGPALKRRAAAATEAAAMSGPGTVRVLDLRRKRSSLLTVTGLTGTYGGYFGAAQGVILLSSLSIMLDGTIQRANAAKNALVASANFAAGAVFVVLTPIDWTAAAIIAVGAVIGGQIGARLGRRIPELALRMTIVAVGLVAIVSLLAG